MVLALRILGDGDGETVGDDDEMALLAIEVEREGVGPVEGRVWRHGEELGGSRGACGGRERGRRRRRLRTLRLEEGEGTLWACRRGGRGGGRGTRREGGVGRW